MDNKNELEKHFISTIDYLLSLKHEVTEVRILRNDRYLKREFVGDTISGYYTPDNYDKLVEHIKKFDGDPGTNGIYTTLQCANPALHARAANRLELNAKQTTNDDWITDFTVFPIDIDANNPPGTSASKQELEIAKQQAIQTSDFLTSIGIPHVKAMSGNGYHILIYVEKLTCNEENNVRWKQVGDLVTSRYNFDVKNYNPSRIWKLYGTTASKGDNTEERPHRKAHIYLPNEVERVEFDDIESKLTAELGETKTSISTTNYQQQPKSITTQTITIREWLDKHGIPYTEKEYKGTFKYQVDCPHDPTHKSPDAWITDEGGTWQFACSHNSCAGQRSSWQAFKDAHGIKQTFNKVEKFACELQEPEPVRLPPEDTSIISFPTEELKGTVFGHYEEAYAGTNETCPAFRFAELVFTFGALFGRNIQLREGTRPIFPNLYICLVGPSAISRKSESIYRAERLMENYESDTFQILPSLASAEGLLSILSETKDVRIACTIDELKWLFTKASQKATESLLPQLNQLWDCRNKVCLPTRSDPLTAIRPTMNLFGSITPQWFRESITKSQVGGGFINRTAFFLHEQMPLKSASEVTTPVANKLSSVKNVIKGIAEKQQFKKLTYSDEVRQADTELYHQEMPKLMEEDDIIRDVIARIDVYIKKFALILAALHNCENEQVHLKEWEQAQAIGNYLKKVNIRLFKDMAFDRLSEQEQRILRHLDALGGKATRTELYNKCSNIPSIELTRHLDALEANEIIAIVPKKGKGGGSLIIRIN